MADNPDIQWALDILTPDPDHQPSLFERYGAHVGVPFSLFAGACMRNKFLSKPVFSGFQVHVIVSLVGFAVTYKLAEYSDNYNARRDQILRHYVILHPEDFPPPERKKWADVFNTWVPNR